MDNNEKACLWIVATPIGNLEDLSPRAAHILKTVTAVAAEDTRQAAKLLGHIRADVPVFTYHDHNKEQKVSAVLKRLRAGESVALISDAGTPLISDPGYVLVKEARRSGFPVYTVPGACAAVAALSIAGLPTDRFTFEGFLPARRAARRKYLEAIANATATMVFYVSKHRFLDVAKDMCAVFGEQRQALVARELTKRFEQSQSLTLGELATWWAQDSNHQRGEFVLVVAGASENQHDDDTAGIALEQLLIELLALAKTKDAVKAAVRLTGLPKNEVYAKALALKSCDKP